MSNVISFCDYRQRKLEEKMEKEYNIWDHILLESNLDTACFTLTFSDENGIIWSSDGENNDNQK